jgi:hypothetical protein
VNESGLELPPESVTCAELNEQPTLELMPSESVPVPPAGRRSISPLATVTEVMAILAEPGTMELTEPVFPVAVKVHEPEARVSTITEAEVYVFGPKLAPLGPEPLRE